MLGEEGSLLVLRHVLRRQGDDDGDMPGSAGLVGARSVVPGSQHAAEPSDKPRGHSQVLPAHFNGLQAEYMLT